MVEPTPHEPWIERIIREAQDAGKLDVTGGAGKPIPGLSRPYDPAWWARNWIAAERSRENAAEVSLEIERALPRVLARPMVADIRGGLEELNNRIRAHNETNPEHRLAPLDIERLIGDRISHRRG